MLQGFASEIPNRLEPLAVSILRNKRQNPLGYGRLTVLPFPILTWLSLKQDELYVIFHEGIWLIRLTKETATAFSLINSIRILVPDNRR
jgi:hypothetical protein